MAAIEKEDKLCKDCKWCNIKNAYGKIEMPAKKSGEIVLPQTYLKSIEYFCGRRVRDIVNGQWSSLDESAWRERGVNTPSMDFVDVCGKEGKYHERG